MSNIIELKGVELAYPIYSIRASSLRNTIANIAVGGKLLKDGQDIIHVKALDGVNFSMEVGHRLGVLGHNGAGKTTLLKVLAGIYEPDRGLVEINGKVSSMIDIGLGLDNALTGRENLLTMGKLRGFSAAMVNSIMPEILEFSELGSYIELPVKAYSSGMRARLVFALATTLEPDILLFDEWISTGDANFAAKATKRMQKLLSVSRALVLATHNEKMVRDICNKLLVLDGGRQLFFGSTDDWDFQKRQPK
jgi:lipopolysaccharide transport system ATP-binding protein